MTTTNTGTWEKHPAPFNPKILDAVTDVLRVESTRVGHKLRVLDPFAGTGRIHWLADKLATDWVSNTVGVEIEPEGHAMDARTLVGDATDLPAEWSGQFDAVISSPVYGNRVSDSHDAKDACKTCDGEGAVERLATPAEVDAGCELGIAFDPCTMCGGSGLSKRNTYKHTLGRDPAPNSAATMHFGSKYRDLHDAAWAEAHRCLVPGGIAVVNVKNHYRTVTRGGTKSVELVRVVEYHLNAWLLLGTALVAATPVPLRGNRMGANGALRVDHEMILVLRKVEV